MMYLTSDNHFGHRNIIGYCDRPFKTVEEMDWAMIDRWNQNVGQEDTVLVVGDFSFYDFDKTKFILQQLSGRKQLIRGNHDKSHSDTWFHKAGFDVVTEHLEIPYVPEAKAVFVGPEEELPYMLIDSIMIQHYHDYAGRGSVLFHGHAHNYFKAKHYVTNKRVLLNVGVDCWNFAPVHMDFLLDTVKRIRQQHEEEGKTLWKVGEI